MRDIRITKDGDFVLTESRDFSTVENSEALIQNAFCRLTSSDPDWYMETICANLEDLLGQRNTKELGTAGEDKIRLCLGDLVSPQNLYVQGVPVNRYTILFYVYFLLEEDADPIGIEVELNLSAGAKARRVS